MHKTFIIAHDMFPYQRVIGGSVRALGFYKSIKNNGGEVSIISAKKYYESGYFGFVVPENTTYLEYPCYIKKFLKRSSIASNYSYTRTSSKRVFIKNLINYLGFRDLSLFLRYNLSVYLQKKVNQSGTLNIVYTSPPYWLSYSIVRLKARYGKKVNFVFDIRDSWNSMLSRYTIGLSRARDSFFKKKVLEAADFITCATNGIKEEIDSIYKSLNMKKRAFLLENGFFLKDYEFMERIPPEKNSILTIVHGGSLDFCDPKNTFLNNMLRAFERLYKDTHDFRVIFAGNVNENERFIKLKKMGIFETITLNHKDYLKLLKKADILLVTNPDKERDFEAMGSKTYEYLAAKKPILALVSQDTPLGKLITTLRVGEIANILNESEIYNCIIKMLQNLKSEKKKVYEVREEDILNYSREHQNKILLNLLK